MNREKLAERCAVLTEVLEAIDHHIAIREKAEAVRPIVSRQASRALHALRLDIEARLEASSNAWRLG